MIPFRSELQGLQGVLGSLEGMDAALYALMAKEHKPTGAHGAMTVDSATAGGHPATLLNRATLVPGSRIQNTTTPGNLMTGTSPFTIGQNDAIQFICQWENFNNDLSSNSITVDFQWGSQVYEVLDFALFGISVRASAVVLQFELWLFRKGNDLYIRSFVSGAEGLVFRGGVFSAARMTAGTPIKVIVEMDTADTAFWQEGIGGQAYHHRL